MLNRKLITLILVAVIIIVPVAAFSYVAWGPPKLDDIVLDSVVPDSDRLSVLIIGSAPGTGAAFDESVNLLVFHDAEQGYSCKVSFRDCYLQHKLPLSSFAVGNGEYEFRLIWNEFKSQYIFDLDMVVEELGVFSSGSYNIQDAPPGTQPWHVVYSYTAVFRTGWNLFSHKIDGGEFATYPLGSKFTTDPSSPLTIEADVSHGVKVEVWFEDQQGAQSLYQTFSVAAGETINQNIAHTQNGSYTYKYINDNTVPIEIKAFENRLIEKLPDNQVVDFLFELGSESQVEDQLVNEIDHVVGAIRPTLGPGDYDVTITYENPTVKPGNALETVTFTESILLNDKPRGDTSAGEPYRIGTLPGSRTVTFDATSSFDDGSKADLTVFWFFGANDEGEIGSAEGDWETYSVFTFTYPVGENPNLATGRPYLILKDSYGAESSIAYVNIQVS
jgi:hypothetical protein